MIQRWAKKAFGQRPLKVTADLLQLTNEHKLGAGWTGEERRGEEAAPRRRWLMSKPKLLRRGATLPLIAKAPLPLSLSLSPSLSLSAHGRSSSLVQVRHMFSRDNESLTELDYWCIYYRFVRICPASGVNTLDRKSDVTKWHRDLNLKASRQRQTFLSLIS